MADQMILTGQDHQGDGGGQGLAQGQGLVPTRHVAGARAAIPVNVPTAAPETGPVTNPATNPVTDPTLHANHATHGHGLGHVQGRTRSHGGP